MKHAVITGASSGIGQELALAYLKNKNYKVSVCGRRLNVLHDLYHEHSQVYYHEADVSKQDDCKNFIEAAIHKNGPIDILINNAGISMRALFDEHLDLQVLQNLMNINFWGAVYCTQYALASLKSTKGVVCGVSSIAGYRGLPARTGYSASKFALQGWSEALRTELLHSGVHVMWVCPGFTKSNIRNVALNASGQSQGETPLKEDKLMTTEECAMRIIDAIDARKRTVVMTGQGKLTVWLNKLFPSLADKLVFNHFAKEPDSPLKK
jgi:short-subunit dehydrogenase